MKVEEKNLREQISDLKKELNNLENVKRDCLHNGIDDLWCRLEMEQVEAEIDNLEYELEQLTNK